jgi:hypothetical protein
MAQTDAGFTVELLGHWESDGWAVVDRDSGLPRRVIAAYLTREQAEAAAERLQKDRAH